ncbi:MAG: isoprenylcysteine carboxylmethyltransferase family protein [Chitinophagaceae bacterium]|nr:isoprenylcysteine carboxylmethyltransferase family protein [Chitinophagaceae bacterium]
MANKKDSPGVYIPPPLFYVLVFLAAVFIQKYIPIDTSVFHLPVTKIAGILLLVTSLAFLITSFRKFFQSKNTLILIKPATSLQTSGIFNISRNPMYVGLVFIFLGLTCLIGNWWNIILFPILLLIMQQYVIKKEEQYLERAFGQKYIDYKKNVRRWL